MTEDGEAAPGDEPAADLLADALAVSVMGGVAAAVHDHRRLERLLDAATREPGAIDLESYDKLRAGLLRHIGMEEMNTDPRLKFSVLGQDARSTQTSPGCVRRDPWGM